ncbi:MAG: tetratricopeptide repeat protein [Bacteroidia bacterium]
MKSRLLYFSALFFCFYGNLFPQKKDKNWLLTDSVRYEDIAPSTRPFVDSILGLYHKAKNDSVKVDLLLVLAEGIEEERVWIHYNKLAYDLACKHETQPAFIIFKGNALNNMGYHAQTVGDNKGAIDLYSQALTLREKAGYKEGIANSLNNLGYVFDDLGDLEKAEEYYRRALKIREQTGEKTGIVNTLNNLGTLYYEKKEFKKAETYFDQALKIAKEAGFRKGIGSALNNLGNIYSEYGDNRKALQYQEAALKYKEEILDAKGLCGTYLNFANIYDDLNESEKVEEYALKALAIAQENGLPQSIRDACWVLFRHYKRSGQFEKALNNYQTYIRMRDSVNNEVVRKASLKQQFKYEFDRKEAALKAEHEKEQALAASESKRQRLFLFFVGALALAVTAVALIIMRSLRITQKQKRIIEKQKQMVEEKQKEILDSIHYAKRIQKALLPSEKFISRNIKELGK